MEPYYRLSFRNSLADAGKRVIIEFVNRKHTVSILLFTFITLFTFISIYFDRLNISHSCYSEISLCTYYQFLWDGVQNYSVRRQSAMFFLTGKWQPLGYCYRNVYFRFLETLDPPQYTIHTVINHGSQLKSFVRILVTKHRYNFLSFCAEKSIFCTCAQLSFLLQVIL